MKNKVASVQWDPEDIFGLHLFTCNGQYIKYKLGQTVNYCNFGLDFGKCNNIWNVKLLVVLNSVLS